MLLAWGISCSWHASKSNGLPLMCSNSTSHLCFVLICFNLTISFVPVIYLSGRYLGLELGYLGHYLLLTGYDAPSAEFLYLDPAAAPPAAGGGASRLPAAQLDAARRAFGTDEDLLIIDVAPPALEPQP